MHDFFVDAPRRKRPVGEIEFSEIHADFGTAIQAFHIGAGASATPGMIPGLFELHRRHGSLPMTRLVEPAVHAARDGHQVSEFQAFLFSVAGSILTWSAEARSLFAPAGHLLQAGEILHNPDLADTLEALALEGEEFGTSGALKTAMLDHQAEAGHLTNEDFAAYQVAVRAPLVVARSGWQVALNPPPSVGGTLVAAMLAELHEKSGDRLSIARTIDTIDKRWREAPRDLTRLLPEGAMTGEVNSLAQRGTTHVSAIDAEGNAVAITVSNGEGNGRIVPGCGFMVNNMLGEEDINPDGFHAWAPGERLASMMAPSVATRPDGDLLALGTGGSNRIRTAILQVLLNRIDRGMALNAAISAPRLHVEKGHLDFECCSESNDAPLATFADRRPWDAASLYFGGVHAVERFSDGGFDGAGDPRRAGVYIRA